MYLSKNTINGQVLPLLLQRFKILKIPQKFTILKIIFFLETKFYEKILEQILAYRD